MQRMLRLGRCWRTGAALVALGLAASCSVYRPLDQGSSVPWAAAYQRADAAASGDLSAGAASAATLPSDGYRVRRGDRLGLLADRFGLSVPELARANDLQPPYVIRVGQVLRIPGQALPIGPQDRMVADSGRASPGAAPVEVTALLPDAIAAEHRTKDEVATQVAALDVAALPPPDRSTVAPAATAGLTPELKPATLAAPSGANYTVRPGETLSGIAQRLDVGLTELARANDIREPYPLHAGQQLRVPREGSYRTTTVRLGEAEARTVHLGTGSPPPLDGDDFLWPVNGKVIGAYGPIDQWRRRDGIDIAARRGAPVLAAQDGIVAYAGDGIRGYGQMVLLRHDQDYITTYAHNATLLVRAGDVVRRGQVIARVGDSGDATQTMLHFELRKGRKPIDPQTRLVHDARTLASAE
jgi:murein DD-endopeptidase MepM/ murein hydrolase activator NlpD